MPGDSADGGEATGAAALRRRSKRRKKGQGTATAPPKEATEKERQPTPEERLAAFGEAFMSSIEQGPARAPRAKAAQRDSTAPAASHATGMARGGGARKKRNKKRRREAEATQEAAKSASTDTMLAAADADQSKRGAQPRAPSAAERRRFMSGKVSNTWGARREEGARRRNDPQSSEDAEFKSILRDVLDYVTPQLGKEQRKQYEEAKIRALGGTLDKREKMPYALLQRIRKGNEVTRQKALNKEKLLGVSTSISKHRTKYAVDSLLKQKKEALKEKKRRQNDGLLRLGLGAREKGGLAVVPSRAIRSYSRKMGH